jgi:hypothetical protein
VLLLLALPCFGISYICHSLGYMVASSAGGGLDLARVDTGRLIQVLLVGGAISIISILYLYFVSQRAVFRHTLHHMKIADVFMFWLLCFAYMMDAFLSAAYPQFHESHRTLAKVCFLAPYFLYLFVYFAMAMPAKKRAKPADPQFEHPIDFILPQLSLRVVDTLVFVGLIVTFALAWREAANPGVRPTTILQTISPKYWAILISCVALVVNHLGRFWIARRTFVWDAYKSHIGHVRLLEEKRLEFGIGGGVEVDVIVDIGCGAGERLSQLLRDPRVPVDIASLDIIACDAQFTNDRIAEFKSNLILTANIPASRIHCKSRIPDLLSDPVILPRLCRGGGVTLVFVSHALYYRSLTTELTGLLKQLPGEVIVAVRGSGLRSFWAIVESIMSVKAVHPSAGQFWRVRYLPQLCRAADLVRLADPSIALADVGEKPDDIIDQAIDWDEAAAASTLDLLSTWHGSYLRDVLSTVAMRLTALDRRVFIPAEDVQFWFKREPSDLIIKTRRRGMTTFDSTHVVFDEIATSVTPVQVERRERQPTR